MSFLLTHPGLDELSDFLAGDRRGRAVGAHVERCARCQESLRFLRSLDAAAGDDAGAPSPDLLARVLATRAAGARVVLPTADPTPAARARWPLAAVAAILLAVLGVVFSTHEGDVVAGTTSGTLRLTPSAPKRGEAVTVRYAPAVTLGGRPWLALRARVRSPNGDSYNGGIPTVTLARLRRGGDGAYTATVTLPDSVVYAALAVEDGAGTVVDANGGRMWELLVAGADGRPTFDALDQRAHDMMGRNAEEGFATVRRMVALYPDDLRAWIWLRFHQSLLGRAQDDTTVRRHRATYAAFAARYAGAADVPADALGAFARYASTVVDSAVAWPWRERLMREAPTNTYAIQWRLFHELRALSSTHDTTAALARLEALWREAPPERAQQVAQYSLDVALRGGDAATALRWADRRVTTDRDTDGASRYVARLLARTPSLRAEGMRRLRLALAALDTLAPSGRALTETVAAQRARHARSRRATLAALGRALVADGRHAAALDTLRLAAADGWDLGVFRDVRAASLAAGDTATAQRLAARIAADPRADAAFADSVRRRLPAAALDAGRAEFVDRMLRDAPVKSLAGRVRLRDAEGRAHDLRALAGGRVTVVAFTSRFCGYAIDDLPRLDAVARRLQAAGVRVVAVFEEAGPSDELRAFLKEKRAQLPTYLDDRQEASRAFNNWGTPHYYVLDAAGRVRFDVATTADEVLARAEALRVHEERRTATR